MSYPRAYFITWSCYGARLHGDSRGTVDRWHNTYDTPRLAPSEAREGWDRDQMAESPFVMSEDAREVVDRTVRAHAEIRGWSVHTLNVRSNHVHVVLSAALDPESIMGQLKAWSSRRLREAELLGGRKRVWTPHGSTKYLWDGVGLEETIVYVREFQD